jgi:two-component system CheB/CheR fusion protein
LEAFIALFRALPADTGMAFVLVPHLAPSHTSALAEILSRTTSMPIQEAADELKVQPNRGSIARTLCGRLPASRTCTVSAMRFATSLPSMTG